MNKVHKILGVALLLVVMLILTAYALAEISPSLMANIGWHDFASVGWVTTPA